MRNFLFQISIPNTPFTIHFTAERCHLLGIGKRLLCTYKFSVSATKTKKKKKKRKMTVAFK